MSCVKTRLTELLNIRYPIIQAGMVWCSGADLAAAVANAGGLGLIGAGSMKPDVLRTHIKKTKLRVKEGKFGVNLPLLGKYSGELAEIILQEKVEIVVTAAGSPRKYTEIFKKAGAIVGHVVPSAALAQKCEAAGVDFVIAEGTEAGGHNSPDEIGTMVLIPQVVDSIDIPVVAAGGIGDGRGLAAALALGAGGAQIGTRFAATVESSASSLFKEMIVNAGEADTRLTLKKLMPTRMLHSPFAEEAFAAEQRGADIEELKNILGTGRAKAGIFEGDYQKGEFEAGEISGLIADIPAAGDLVRRIVSECEAVIARLK